MKETIQKLIEKLKLEPHPEGGYFKETYRSKESIDLDAPFYGTRNYSTSIYFMLTADTFSAFHKIKQDEAWHFYQGDPIDLHMIHPDGEHELIKLGHNIFYDEVPQFIVPAESWFAAKSIGAKGYSLVGCTVSPGFDFADFELATEESLLQIFGMHAALIREFTRK